MERNGRRTLHVIATTISGSVADWGKIPRLAPLFGRSFPGRVRVHVVDSHEAARAAAKACARDGGRWFVSAGGGGTFNRVVRGLLDSGRPLEELRVGFLRKGSADLVGKALGVPDDVEAAVDRISHGFLEDRTLDCDMVRVFEEGRPGARHIVGFGGFGVMGDIPRFTDSRWMKYYKGVFGTLFGDLGPFRIGAGLALGARLLGGARSSPRMRLEVDGEPLPGDKWLSVLLLNGGLGPDMPFARGMSLGGGRFYVAALRDLGLRFVPGQLRGSFSGAVLEAPQRWGLELRAVESSLLVRPAPEAGSYPVNLDGLPGTAEGALAFRARGKLKLIRG